MLRRWRFLNFSNLGFMHSWLMHGPRRAQFGPFLCQNFTWAPTVPKSPIRPTERPHMCCRLGPIPDGVSPIQEPGPFVHTHSPMKAEIGRFFVLDVCPPILQTIRASSSLWQSRVYLTAEAWPGTKAAAAANLGRYEPTHGQICPP